VSDPLPSFSRYRPDIDGLRALAIFAVIINHFDKRALPGGFLGVDSFFVSL
jgi:peptidoglycan/LPS O-acetylase OafA/YrhL